MNAVIDRKRSMLALALALALLMVSGFSSSAEAGSYPSTSLGSRTSSTLSYVDTDVNGDRYALTTTVYLGWNNSTSVHINSIKVCYSGASGTSVMIHPWIRNVTNGLIWEPYGYKSFVYTNQAVCQSWTVNKTIAKPSNSSYDIFRVTLNVTSITWVDSPIYAWYK